MTPDIGGNEPDEMARLLRERLPRHQAPARLRVSVAEALDPPRRRRPSLWLAPGLSALATAMVMLLWLAPSLPRSGPDQLQRLSRAVVSEYARAVFAEEVNPDAVPASLPRVMKESGVRNSSGMRPRARSRSIWAPAVSPSSAGAWWNIGASPSGTPASLSAGSRSRRR